MRNISKWYGVPTPAWVVNILLTIAVAVISAWGVQVRHSVEISNLKAEVIVLKNDNKDYLKSISEMSTDIKYIREHLANK